MTEITIDIQIYCGNCGAGLCRNTSGRGGCFTVDPCEKCLEDARKEGHSDGYDEGYNEGYADILAESQGEK